MAVSTEVEMRPTRELLKSQVRPENMIHLKLYLFVFLEGSTLGVDCSVSHGQAKMARVQAPKFCSVLQTLTSHL